MIKKLSTLSLIAMAFAATPAMAQQTGHVGVQYTDNNDADTSVWAVDGATTFAFSEHVGAQVDGNIASYDDGSDSQIGWRLNGHLFYNAGAFRVGGLFGTTRVDADTGIEPEATHWGVEGQYNFGNIVLGASSIWGEADGIISPSLDYDNIDLNGDFYVTDNLVFGASYAFGSLDNGVSEVDTTNYSIDGEYQFSTLPLSLIASWQHWEIDDVPLESEAFTVGARWNWGGTLRERDGAGFRNSPPSIIERVTGSP